MIQKKSLKEAIQNPEIISVVGGLLNYVKVQILTPQNLDADNLIGDNIIYRVNADLNSNEWLNKEFNNFPQGSLSAFVLECCKIGSSYYYQKLSQFNTPNIYIRYTTYDGILQKIIWSEWKVIVPVDIITMI